MRNIILILICIFAGVVGGYLYNPVTQNIAGIRGGAQTGFYVGGGEFISIGSSSPRYDLTVYRDTARMSTATQAAAATSTLIMHASSTPGACIIMEDYDSAGYTYCNFLDGVQTCSSTNICYN